MHSFSLCRGDALFRGSAVIKALNDPILGYHRASVCVATKEHVALGLVAIHQRHVARQTNSG
jgi:hypothetical protein